MREFDSLNDFPFKSKSFVKPTYLVNITTPVVSKWEEELYSLHGSNAVLIEKLPKMSLGHGILMQHNVTSYIDGLKICKNELQTRPQDCPYFKYFKKSWE